MRGPDPVEQLRARGIQVTAQRLAVLRAVSAEPHITAEAVADVVRAEIGAISLQSVYDALNLLVAEGLVRRIQPAGSPARFEDRVDDDHHHLICRGCGRVVDVSSPAGLAPRLAAVDGHGYEIDEAEVVYWGRCPACQQQARGTQRGAVAMGVAGAGRRPAGRSSGRRLPPRPASTHHRKTPGA